MRNIIALIQSTGMEGKSGKVIVIVHYFDLFWTFTLVITKQLFQMCVKLQLNLFYASSTEAAMHGKVGSEFET